MKLYLTVETPDSDIENKQYFLCSRNVQNCDRIVPSGETPSEMVKVLTELTELEYKSLQISYQGHLSIAELATCLVQGILKL